MPQHGQAIDLSAGLIPKPTVGNDIDLSAGLIPKQSAPQQSGMGTFYEASGAKGLMESFRHPLETASTVLDAGKRVFTPGQPQRMSDNPNPIIRGIGQQVEPFGEAIKNAWYSPSKENMQQVARTVPIAGPGLQRAQKYYDQGNTAAAVGTVLGTATGLVAPELLKGAPRVLSGAARATGEFLQDSGANRMDRFLNAGKKLPVGEYEAPGRTVLERGPSTSFAANRPALTEQIRTARRGAGPKVGAAYKGSKARIPIPDVKNAIDSTIDPMRKTANGWGGNPNMLPRFDQLRTSFGPSIDLNGTTSPGALHEGMRELDKNINWNRGPDPLDATARNASRQIRGKLRNVLDTYAPEGIAPSRDYHNLSDALDLSEDNQNKATAKGGWGRVGMDVAAGVAAGAATGNPMIGVGGAAAAHLLPPVWRLTPVQTGIATGAYQLGRGLEWGGNFGGKAVPLAQRVMERVPAFVGRPALAMPLLRTSALQPRTDNQGGNENRKSQNNQNSNQFAQQFAPPRGTESSIRPAIEPTEIIPPQNSSNVPLRASTRALQSVSPYFQKKTTSSSGKKGRISTNGMLTPDQQNFTTVRAPQR